MGRGSIYHQWALSSVRTVLVGTLFMACATPYQAMGWTGGYDNVQVKPDVFFVEVKGNGYAGRTTLIGYFHRRAKALCDAAGFADYIVTSEEHGTSHQSINLPNTYTGTTHGQKIGDSYQGHTTVRQAGGGSISIAKHDVSGYIRCTGAVKISSPPEKAEPSSSDDRHVPSRPEHEATQDAGISHPEKSPAKFCVSFAKEGAAESACFPSMAECQRHQESLPTIIVECGPVTD